MERHVRGLATALVVLLSAPGAWAQDAAVEEIVVTARKRAEFIEDTPLSVTAISPQRLRESDVTRLDDVRRLAPGLQFQATPIGLDQASQFRIRGVGTTRVGTSFDPGVAVYVDGVYIPRGVASIINLIDVQQIEVLRGPQGTLFGKNTVGGAISVTTAKPTDEFEGSILIRPGNFDSIDTRAMLNVPLTERVATRLAFTSTNFGGFHTNTLLGEELGERAGLGVLGSIRADLTDDLTFHLTGQWNRNDGRGSADRCVVAEGSAAPLAPPGFLDACRRSKPFEGQHNETEVVSQESYGLWGVLDLDLGDVGALEDLSLKSITAWSDGGTRFRGDVDGTELDVIRVAAIGDGPADGRPTSGRSIMQEGQVSAAALDGRLNMIAGAFAFWEEAEVPQTTQANLGGAFFQSTFQSARSDNWDWAIFTQATADVTDWLSVTGGVRYTEEKKGQRIESQALLPAMGEVTRRSGRVVFTSWTPMASVALSMPEDWMDETPLEHLMTYFTYSRGFRGGGFNVAANTAGSEESLGAFEPEELDSFEVGLKAIAWDQRLNMNLSLFRYDYQNIQVLSTTLDAEGNLLQLTNNAGAATGQGVELELRARPLPFLIINGSLGYLDTEYDEFSGAVSDLTNETIDRAGEGFNNSPKLQTNLAIQLMLPIEPASADWLHGVLSPRLEWYYQSSERYAGPELLAARQSGYNLLNARLNYVFMEGRAQVAFWVKNLTDREYFSNAQPLGSTFGHVLRTYNPPRTFGAELVYRFSADA